ncbi:MAG: class I SAM-dependent methyltransferase family protein [Nanoarchaeota archaeon]|nr:class I SAM-dependent methyltransferase family protein [Nanoarchaeota archaeon]
MLKRNLKRKITKQELSMLPRAFDIVGNIAIINLPRELRRKEKLVAQEILKLKNIETVVNKIGGITGKLRRTPYKVVSGKKTFETMHKENNCRMKMDISKVYFSPRLASDRLDIAKQVKKNEKILVMFAGILPYTLVIARNSKAKEIYAIEINKSAAKYALENIKLNKVDNVVFIRGDVKKVIPSFKRKGMKFDRIVMPRPQIRDTFLKYAFSVAKKGTIIHFHDFLKEEEIPVVAEGRIRQEAFYAKRKVKILRCKKTGEIAPYKYRVRVDFQVL